MKRFIGLLVLVLVMGSGFTGCGPFKGPQFEEIEPNETAFLVPLEGQTQAGQKKFMSVEFLDGAKIAAKRIEYPLKRIDTGRMPWEYKWVRTMRVVKVNRTPVTREWTGDSSTGTSGKNEALWVESRDSIGFGVGVNVTAAITEDDASKFLYFYAGVPLNTVVDQNVRGFVNSVLAREFANYDLEKARAEKNTIFAKAKQEAVAHFAQYGVTITNLGLAEGLVYEDKEIQDAINKKFTAEMQVQIEEQSNLAQDKINERNVSIATAERRAADEFAKAAEARKKMVDVDIAMVLAQAQKLMAERWDGHMPASIIPSNSPLLMNIPGARQLAQAEAPK